MADNVFTTTDVGNTSTDTDEFEKDKADGQPILGDFISQQYQQQKDERMLLDPTDQLNSERTEKFYLRAFSESQRMSSEVKKSQQEQHNLYAEVGGSEIFKAWKTEHENYSLEPL